MTAFNAAEAVEPLEFSLKPYSDVEGVVPEPSRDQVDTYWAEVQGAMEAAGMDRERMLEAEKLGGATTAEGRALLIEIMAEATPEKLKESTQRQLEAAAALCGGSPTLEQIRELPYRAQEKFIGWLVGAFRPQSSNGVVTD